jgi:predicted RNase H-like HicB family nuclease
MFRKSLAALSFVLSTGGASAGGSESQAGACSELVMRRAGEREPHGALGFVEELPGVNSHGRTLEEAREMLGKVAAIAFDAERERVEEFIAGKDYVREPLAMARQTRDGE